MQPFDFARERLRRGVVAQFARQRRATVKNNSIADRGFRQLRGNANLVYGQLVLPNHVHRFDDLLPDCLAALPPGVFGLVKPAQRRAEGLQYLENRVR